MSTVPVDPIVEMLVDGVWRDITPDCRLNSAASGGGIHIQRGRSNESPVVEPTQLSFTLNNGESKAEDTLGEVGVYSRRNPYSPYYGLLGRNQPVRVGLSRRHDTFDRTVVDSWGDLPTRTLPDGTTAPTESWTEIAADLTAFDVTPGAATLQIGGGTRMAVFGTFADVEVKTRAQVSDLTTEFGVVVRKEEGVSNWYSCYLIPGTPTRLRISKVYGGVNVWTQTLDLSSFTVAINTDYWIRAQIRGQRIRVKAWPASGDEPLLWTYRTYDNSGPTEDQLPLSGMVGVLAAQGTALVTFKEVEVNQWRAHAEITTLPPRWDLSRVDRWVPVQARGILRRLGQGRKALKSAVRRHLASYTTYGWLPLEENQGSESTGNLAVGGVPGLIKNLTFAAADTSLIPGIAGYVTFGEDTSSISMPVKAHTAPGAQTMLFFMQANVSPTADILLCTIRATGSIIRQYRIYLQSDDTIRVDCYDRTNTIVDTIAGIILFDTADIPYGSWIAVTLYCFDDGGNVNWAVNWHRPGSSSFWTTGTQVLAGTTGIFQNIDFKSSAEHVAVGVSYAHVFHYPGDLPFVSDAFAKAAYAYIGELATVRFMRLCSEHGVSATTTGYSQEANTMGPQLPAKLVDLLEECAAADDAIMTEERDEFALALVTRMGMYNQLQLDLDIDQGHLSAPLDPIDDDQATRNRVTVSRPDGGFATSVQTEGPLNINPPEDDPDGVGEYEEEPELILETDDQLQPAANWRRSRGTLDEVRYPSMTADLTSAAYLDDAALAAVAASIDTGRILSVANAEVSPDASVQVVQSYEEQIDQYDWDITWVTTPGNLHTVGVLDYTTRLDTKYLVVESDFDAGTDTAMTTERTDATKGLWVLPADKPASFPFYIKAAGVVLEVTSASGTSDPQTLTITQTPVNGITKTIPAGSPIKVVDPWRLAW